MEQYDPMESPEMELTALPDPEETESSELEADVLDPEELEELLSTQPQQAEAQETEGMQQTRVKRPKLKMTSAVPSPATRRGPSQPNQARASRLQRASIIREAFSKYPSEIETGVRNMYTLPPSSEGMSEPLKSLYDILRMYMGTDLSSLDFDVIEDRILRSTKADDESDSEHFQRIASALQIINVIKTTRLEGLRELVGLSQKEINDDRQHYRYLMAINTRKDKNDSDISRQEVETEKASYDLQQKRDKDRDISPLQTRLERQELIHKLALHASFPDRPLEPYYNIRDTQPQTAFERRMVYVGGI